MPERLSGEEIMLTSWVVRDGEKVGKAW